MLGPVVVEHRHQFGVDPLAVPEQSLAFDSFADESDLLVDTAGARIDTSSSMRWIPNLPGGGPRRTKPPAILAGRRGEAGVVSWWRILVPPV